MELRNKSCHFVIFAGRPLVLEGASNANDLFDLGDIRVAMVNVVAHSGDCLDNGRVGDLVIGEWDQHEWRSGVCLKCRTRT